MNDISLVSKASAFSNAHDIMLKAPEDVLSNPALLFLFYRIEQILGIKARSDNLKNLNEYIESICNCTFIENPAAFEELLNCRERIFEFSKFITINETYFFREASYFELLTSLLPELSKNLHPRPLQICSAASSIGCEAYSIAMLLDYHINKGINIDYSIDAFDINRESIEIAKTGRYTANAMRQDGKNWHYILDSYLIPDKNEFIVCDKIKQKVNFFSHNILRGFGKQYDIIFFRNALIYFSSKNRHIITNYLASALYPNGLLFLGTSETSSIKHPLLASRDSSGIFYFQKISSPEELPYISENLKLTLPEFTKTELASLAKDEASALKPKKTHTVKKEDIPVYYPDISDILLTEEGKQNAAFVLDMVNKQEITSLFGSQLAAACIYYLQSQELEKAQVILSCLEKYNSDACTKFLRGEYYFLLDNYTEAENYYQQACFKDKCFWPAFYRIAILASDGNRTRYEYKIKKTIESIELSKTEAENSYECFMGGFSSEYFVKILEKKLS